MPVPSTSPGAAAAASSLLALSGTILESRYELGRVLGAGGMGAVFEAKHLRLDRTVAIKLLRPIFVGHDEYIKRFLREAKVASKIRHRNVVEIHDYGEAAGGLVYSVMEYLRGRDLDQFLQAQPGQRVPWQQACNLLLQAASGLKAAHAAGIIHRDVKPANCFLTTDDDGQPLIKLVDFGIAKIDDGEQTQQLTGIAEVLGTPSYIAPELVMTKSSASPSSDIYSLGVVAYRMLTGRVPFTGDTAFQVLHRACFEPPPPLREQVPDLPPAVEAFVLQMLAKRPDQRPQSMQAVCEALLALGRDTLGAQAVEIPVSGVLSLGSVEPSGPFEPSATTPLPHDIVRFDANAVSGDVYPATEVLLTPPSTDVGQLAPAPPRVGSHRARSRPRQSRWSIGLGAVGLVAVLAVGVVVVHSMMTTSPAPAPTQPAVPVEPRTAPEPAAPIVATTIPDEKLEPAPAPAPTPEPEIEPTPPTEPEHDAEIEPTPPTEPEPKPETTSKPTHAKAAPSGRPSDAELTKKLGRRIKAQCGDSMAGQSIKVSFVVNAEGQIMALSAVPKGTAAQCAINQVKGTMFRKRAAPKDIGFTVK